MRFVDLGLENGALQWVWLSGRRTKHQVAARGAACERRAHLVQPRDAALDDLGCSRGGREAGRGRGKMHWLGKNERHGEGAPVGSWAPLTQAALTQAAEVPPAAPLG